MAAGPWRRQVGAPSCVSSPGEGLVPEPPDQVEEAKPGAAASQTGQDGPGHPTEEPRLAEPRRRGGSGLPRRGRGPPGPPCGPPCTDWGKMPLRCPLGGASSRVSHGWQGACRVPAGQRLFLQGENKLFMRGRGRRRKWSWFMGSPVGLGVVPGCGVGG